MEVVNPEQRTYVTPLLWLPGVLLGFTALSSSLLMALTVTTSLCIIFQVFKARLNAPQQILTVLTWCSSSLRSSAICRSTPSLEGAVFDELHPIKVYCFLFCISSTCILDRAQTVMHS